jgi:hypothetical protein
MNYLLEPFVESMLRLEKGKLSIIWVFVTAFNWCPTGIEFTVHGHDDPEVSHSHLYCNVSDLPSSRKVTGLQGHSSKFFMCPTCKTPSFSLAHPSCFNPSSTYLTVIRCSITANICSHRLQGPRWLEVYQVFISFTQCRLCDCRHHSWESRCPLVCPQLPSRLDACS